MDIKLIIAFAVVIAMAMLHFGIQIYRALKKEAPVNTPSVNVNPGNEILIELTKTSEGVKHLGETMTEYKKDNDKAHDKIFDLINKILLKKGG